jgi:hypothetical protein
MRTTINLEDDIMPAVKQYAKSRSVGLGKAVSELLRRGISAVRPMRMVNGIYVVDLPEDSPRITSEHVRALEAEDR